MPCALEYDTSVRPSRPVSLFLSLLAALLFLSASSHAQINGPPVSVTSPGFGGRPVNGTPSSVTSLGPRGYSPGQAAPNAHHGDGHHHHDATYSAPLVYAVPVPYYAADDAPAGNPDDDPNDQGGPTIFDRRGSGASSYVPPVGDVPLPHAGYSGESLSDPEPASEPTVLVFKDGHQLEVGNYAIVGTTLIDLTPGHARKVPLAELDLPATQKLNDDHGIVFQLPPSPQSN